MLKNEHEVYAELWKHSRGVHPRLLFTEDRLAAMKNAYATDPVAQKIYGTVIAKADAALDKRLGQFRIYDGLRAAEHNTIHNYLLDLAFAYYLTGEKKYADRAVAELVNVSEWPDWNAEHHYLDVGWTAMFMGFGYDWFYHEMTEEQRAKCRKTIVNNSFHHAFECDFYQTRRQTGYNWYNDTPGDNWKFICGGGIATAAMAMFDEGDVAAECEIVFTYVYREIYKFIRNIYEGRDGSYMEGSSYWHYGQEQLTLYAAFLETAVGSIFDLCDWEGIQKTGNFALMISNNEYKSFQFGDGGVYTNMNCSDLLWLGHITGDYTLSAMRIDAIMAGKVNPDSYDAVHYRTEEYKPISDLSTDYVQKDVPNATFRTGWNHDAVFTGIHFGHNQVCHGHLDMGDFIVDYADTRFITDVEKENYNLKGCYQSYRVRAEGHNTVVFNPNELPDQKWAGETYISACASNENEAFAVADMTSAYYGQNVLRGLKLIKKTGAVLIQDDIKCSAEDDLYWYAHTCAEIEILNGGKTAKLTQDGKTFWCEILADGEFAVAEAKSHPGSPKIEGQSPNDGTRKLVINMKGKDAYTIAVAFAADDEGAKSAKVTPVAQW